MPERLEKLRETLAELERELDELPELDDATRQQLQEAKQDIEQALHEQTPPDQWEPQSFMERLNESTEQFEATHPTLTGLVQRVVDALSQLGI